MTTGPWLWHRKLGHVSLDSIKKLARLGLVRGIPPINSKTKGLCDAYMKDKLHKSSFKPKNVVSNIQPLQLIHMDLFGLVVPASMNRKRYVFVIVDDYSHLTWIIFLENKDEAFDKFNEFRILVENEK